MKIDVKQGEDKMKKKAVEKSKKAVNEFKQFITRGNVVDMAVGVIVGSAFSKIVSSLVNDILMPPLTYILGKPGLDELKLVIVQANEETGAAEVAVRYGTFFQTILDFIIIAFSVFIFVKIFANIRTKVEAIKRKEEEEKRKEEEARQKEEEEKRLAEEAQKPKPPTQEEILADIRDTLKEILLEIDK